MQRFIYKDAYCGVIYNRNNWKKNSQQKEIGFLKNMIHPFVQCAGLKNCYRRIINKKKCS